MQAIFIPQIRKNCFCCCARVNSELLTIEILFDHTTDVQDEISWVCSQVFPKVMNETNKKRLKNSPDAPKSRSSSSERVKSKRSSSLSSISILCHAAKKINFLPFNFFASSSPHSITKNRFNVYFHDKVINLPCVLCSICQRLVKKSFMKLNLSKKKLK